MARDIFKLDCTTENGFCTIGKGPLGGKARGLLFLKALLRDKEQRLEKYSDVKIIIPSTLVIAGDAFEAFIQENRLGHLRFSDLADEQIAGEFIKADIPAGVKQSLAQYLSGVNYPVAVRSSGLLEDAMYHAYAGLYSTYMLPNDQDQERHRLDQLLRAIKLVYASTFFKGPRAYAKRVGHNMANDSMAVMIQQLAGVQRGRYCYPDISGVAQSKNFYPLAGIKPDDGLATIALGLGKQVVSGARALRFSPRYPNRLPQCNTVEDMLAYAQRYFYALPMGEDAKLEVDERTNLWRREVNSALDELPLEAIAGTYVLDEHRIRDNVHMAGSKVLTFAGVLKFNLFPLAGLLQDLLSFCLEALQTPVEMEFAVNLFYKQAPKAQFHLLQMRPMTARTQGAHVTIDPDEGRQTLCFSSHAMGNGSQRVKDVIYVKPDTFDSARTRDIAVQIARINARLEADQRNYLLIGPGRWGSADPWLGIPVRWADISQVGTIVETASQKIKAEPSQGAHFFHNLSALGISYLSVAQRAPETIDWAWLQEQPRQIETDDVVHVRTDKPLLIKVDGRTAQGAIIIEQ